MKIGDLLGKTVLIELRLGRRLHFRTVGKIRFKKSAGDSTASFELVVRLYPNRD